MTGNGTLGNFVTLQRGKTYKSKLLHTPGPYLLGLASIARNGGFRADNLKTYGGDAPESLLLRPGDLYVSLKDVTQSGDLLGSIARVPESIPLGRLTQDTVKLQLADDAPPASYIYWLLRTPEYRAYCRCHATGTTNLGLAREDFLAFPVPVLSRARELIVSSLDNIEAKIEQNRRTARMLERLARAIFKAWFVDFEPVKAKAAGAESFPSMPQEVFDALPTAFEDSEIGPVPEGWEVKALSKMCEILSGGTPKRSESAYWGHDIPWYSVKDAPADGQVWVYNTDECISEKGLENSAANIVPRGCTIISARGTVGKLALTGRPMSFNQSCYGLMPADGQSCSWLYLLVHSVVANLQQRTHGSVFDTITRRTFDGLSVVSPSDELIQLFESSIAPLFDLLLASHLESGKLSEMRDCLLPRLLSGDVRVEVVDD